MEKSLYICNAKQPVMVNLHTNIAYCVSSCVPMFTIGLFGDNTKGVRSLFVHTKRKLVTQMPNNNKCVTEAKNSSLSAKTTTIVAIATAIISTLLLIYAPSVLEVIASVIGVVILVVLILFPIVFVTVDNYGRD